MKSSSNRIKYLFICVGLFLVLYIGRHYFFALSVQGFLSYIIKEKFEYKKRTWEEGNLIYEGVSLGDQLHTSQLRLTPEFTLFPFHLSLEVHFTEPEIKLSSQTQSPFNLALFTPTKWTSFKLDIERGTLSIDDEPLGLIDLMSGEQPSMLGTLILSEEQANPYCTCEVWFREQDLYYQISCVAAPAFHLHSFMNLFNVQSPIHLQGGRLDVDIKGTFSAVEGSIIGYDLQFETVQGEFDFHLLTATGQWGDMVSINGWLEGGRFKNGNFILDKTDGQITFQTDKAPFFNLKGHLALGESQGPFNCEVKENIKSYPDRTIDGNFHFGKMEIPFSISHEGITSVINANFNEIPLSWLRQIALFEEGFVSTQASAFFENDKLKVLELKNLHLAQIKIKGFSCDSIQGEATIKEASFIERASLTIKNLTHISGFSKGRGTIIFAENQFQSSELEGEIQHIPGKILWHGIFDKIEGEIFASAPLSIWSRDALKLETPAQIKATFELQNKQLKWQGNVVAFSDQVFAQGEIDFNTLLWGGSFESSSVTLSNYSALVPEGVLELKGKFNPQELNLSCIGTDILIQTESELLQIPGRTSPFELKWSLMDKSLFAQMNIPPSIFHLKTIPSPIYLESGALTWKEGILEISHLQACLGEIIFQGDLAYWETPKPHLQLTSKSLKGPVQDLSILDKRVQGWEGHFICGKEEFLLDVDLDDTLPQIHLKAHIDHLSHQFTSELTLTQGVLDLTYASIGDEIKVREMTGMLSLPNHQLSFHLPRLIGKGDHYSFDIKIPKEKIAFAGEIDKQILTLHQGQVGDSQIKKPLRVSYQNGGWKLQGTVAIALESLPRYAPLVQAAGFMREASFPSMEGTLDVSGWITESTASLDLASNGIKIGNITLPILKGQLKKEKNHFEMDNLSIGEAQLKGHAIYEHNAWLFPNWTALWKDFNLQGSARLEQNICSLKTEGTWKEKISLKGEIKWDIKNQQGKDGHLTLQQEDLKHSSIDERDALLRSFKVILVTNELQYKNSRLEAAKIQTTVIHPLLKESIIALLSLNWTPERIIFQGPFSQGTYENDLFKLKGQEIHALYENDILHFQTKFRFNEAPLKAKGHFTESGSGVVKFFEGNHELQVTFSNFLEITRIEGKLFEIDCSLSKKGTLYEGRLKIGTSDPFAVLLKKPEWKQFGNLEFVGLISSKSFKGTISGNNVTVQGYLLNQLQATIDYCPTQFDIRQVKIEDKAGKLYVKECHGTRSHPLKAWEISIPHLRGQQIQPSLLRKIGVLPTEPKPFQIRQLTLNEVTGIIGRPLTFRGQGSFYFTQKEKRDPSLFDLPRTFLKEWGLDLALLSPARGSAAIELAQGKMLFRSLKETFSDGGHSEFYLADDEPSYIDFNGGLFLNLRMKQNVVLKLAEPFTLSVRGTWQQPLYTLR